MSTLASELRTICTRYNGCAAKRGDTSWDNGFKFAIELITKDIEQAITTQSCATKYPTLGLADLGAHARELGYDVTKGNHRIMISLPPPSLEGDKLIEAEFPKSEEIPQLTPVGADPIKQTDVF